MKRVLSIILALIFAVGGINLLSYAVTAAEISGEDVNTIVGRQIKIPITITDNPGIMGFKLIVEYDMEYLEPVSVEKGSITSAGNFNDSIETSRTNKFDIFWNGSGDAEGDGIIAYLSFIANKAVSDTKIKLSYSQDDTFNEAWEDVVLDCDDISVKIENSDSVSVNGTISMNNISGVKTFATLQISNCTESAYEFSFDVPNTVISPNGINCSAASASLLRKEDSFKITFSDIEEGVTEFTALISITISESFSGDESFAITCEDKICGYFNASAKPIGGAVVVCADNVEGDVGDVVDIPISFSNCAGLMGYKLIFDYDSRKLEPVSVTNTSSLGGNFGDSIESSDGEFSVVWSNSSPMIKDEQVLLLKVKILNVDGGVDGIGISYSADDTFDESWNEVSMICPIILVNTDFSEPGDLHEHVMNEWNVKKAATCTEDGLRERGCSLCDYTETEVIVKEGHSFAENYTVDIKPTCTEKGSKSIHCLKCSEKTSVTEVSALGHSFDNGVVTPPTATEKGYTTYTCQREGCNYSYKDNFVEPIGKVDLIADIETVTARAGETVDVNISIEEPVAVKSMSILNLNYDETKLQLVEAKWLLSDTIIDDWDQEKMTGASAFKSNKNVNGKIFSLKFKVLEDVEDCEIEVDCELVAKTKPDSIEMSLNTLVNPGKIVVKNVICGDFNADEYVDSDDAIYLLYATLLPDSYLLNQSGDINHDGYVDSDDAIYLLYHTLLPDLYPLN